MTRQYHIRDEDGVETTVEADDMAGAHRLAEAWVREGDYDDIEGTEAVAYWIVPIMDDGEPSEEEEERGTVRIDPPEPECRRGDYDLPAEHDWEDGQPRGDGGGVMGTDACRRCGLRRHWGTWDSRHDRPGRSVRYERED